MPRIAISGHRDLNAHTADLINQAICEKLSGQPSNVTGLSCLADGTDQIFARAVVDLGGKLEVIVPAEEYRVGLPTEAHAEYDDLLARAVSVHLLPFTESTAESHMAASKLMIDEADELKGTSSAAATLQEFLDGANNGGNAHTRRLVWDAYAENTSGRRL